MLRLCFFVIFITVQSVAVEQDHNKNLDDRTIFRDPHHQFKMEQEIVHHRVPRGVIWDKKNRWPSSTIPYEISSKISKPTRDEIKRGIALLESKTCLKFKQRTGGCREKRFLSFLFGTKPCMPEDYIFFQDDDRDCYADIGRRGGKQIINVGDCSEAVFLIIHEIMHALGFAHEHQRMDRDEYIEVRYNNLIARYKSEFDKLDSDTMGIPYDFYSVMHYDSYSWSKDGNKPVLVPKVSIDKVT
ncbi:zinc metalloproteinase nas-8-like [Planococcus citri]|uniref:zinc metalloproteinase nas-8-like n=1 Tax=Planococcus citri TaxID=170843 RepID=UPI0031F787FE